MVVRVGGQTRYDGMAEGELGEMADGVDVGGWVGEFGDFLVGGGQELCWCMGKMLVQSKGG